MRTSTSSPAALLITGTVGSGKTTTARYIGALLRQGATPYAVIDLDALRDAWPSPEADPFHEQLMLANLRDVARNHLAAGALRLVLAGVLEDPAQQPLYEQAAGVPLTVCRLRVDLSDVKGRLRQRHHDDREALDWHLHRSGELDAILNAVGIGDVEVPVAAGQAPSEVAQAVIRAVGWNADATPPVG
ncbi:AAA family ATPase [Kineococcus sp. NBC_00420]|uniref:AAA family ATPase n=1 Tax=Kineococcus sp. NBC_00420 TaxID=2903564 RepID=UPI002E1BC18B